ncbi:glycosyltransferase family 2 protein [Paraburkholderia acidisoli]|uniref:Glycosyltransferase n=1 Tax=Paraburkholderia acidisoli TaxID=2571748 RepID=A0A7Z2GJ30_9BURK|nr:glycosyltransferase family A protein [Paraburkholderia acidisoli]QGZ62638.1 glycosyltransferase [Paraburkholderia acidisoli]
MQPITIIVPCHNGAATLARALDSCIAQQPARQILVVDDGSTDATASFARAHAMREPRVKLAQMPGQGGLARARNWGALAAETPFLAFLDATDEYLPGALAAAVAYLQQFPHEAAVRLDVDFVDFPKVIATHGRFAEFGATLSNTVASSLVMRRSAYLALGGFPVGEFFRRHGGDDGALSWALSQIFGQRRLDNAKRVRHHYRAGAPAERFFRAQMRLDTPDPEHAAEVVRHSRAYLDAARERIHELRALGVSTSAS